MLLQWKSRPVSFPWSLKPFRSGSRGPLALFRDLRYLSHKSFHTLLVCVWHHYQSGPQKQTWMGAHLPLQGTMARFDWDTWANCPVQTEVTGIQGSWGLQRVSEELWEGTSPTGREFLSKPTLSEQSHSPEKCVSCKHRPGREGMMPALSGTWEGGCFPPPLSCFSPHSPGPGGPCPKFQKQMRKEDHREEDPSKAPSQVEGFLPH